MSCLSKIYFPSSGFKKLIARTCIHIGSSFQYVWRKLCVLDCWKVWSAVPIWEVRSAWLTITTLFSLAVACKVSEKLGQTCWSPREMRSFFRFEALFQVFSFRCRSNSIDSSGCCYSNPFLGLVMLVFLTSVNFLQFLVRVFLILSVILQPIVLEVIFVTVTENSSCDHPLLTYFS